MLKLARQITLMLGVSALLIAFALPARSANPNYADCINCHALPIAQAEGVERHDPYGQPPPGYRQFPCFECHEPTVSSGHPAPPGQPYYWVGPLGSSGSAITQMCTGCHLVPHGVPSHPNDVIPYASNTLGLPAPTSSLPLFDWSGRKTQSAVAGGLVCATCHDPHDPSYTLLTTLRPSYLRIGDGTGQITGICEFCHDMGSTTVGSDILIDRTIGSVTFTPRDYDSTVDVAVTITNRGNAGYAGGWMDVGFDNGTGNVMHVYGQGLPGIPPEGSYTAVFPFPGPLDGDDAFFFTLDPSELNPSRINTFVRSLPVPPPPENLRVQAAFPEVVHVAWDFPIGMPGPFGWQFNVYRNGTLITPVPISQIDYFDTGLAPETPVTYTVRTVTPEGITSPESNRVGERTMESLQMLRVPQDYPTIQEAIDGAAGSASIHVAPGVHQGPVNLSGKYGISIIGQDAAGAVLDLMGSGMVELGTNNTIAGFTILGGPVHIGEGGTVSNCIFRGSSPMAVSGGGLLTNCVFDSSSQSVYLEPGRAMLVANSIFISPDPFMAPPPPMANLYLLNNDFVSWHEWGGWDQYPGEGNFSADPAFEFPGPPETYFLQSYSPCVGAGFPMGLGNFDVGSFQQGLVYSPRPPADLNAAWDEAQGAIVLNWTPSPDDPFFGPPVGSPVLEYLIYRSEVPDVFLTNSPPYGWVPAGVTQLPDFFTTSGVTCYYQVRASAGPSPLWPHDTVLSAPTNTASLLLMNSPPENLRVMSVTGTTVDLMWDPPPYYANPWELEYNVYRNGQLITPAPIPGLTFMDAGLAPETPHTYTVAAIAPGNVTSPESARVGTMTQSGAVLRVPQDFSTIQEAIVYAGPGTSIHVAPGVYPEDHLYLRPGKNGIAIVGQDANGVVLDLGWGGELDLDQLADTNNTISGFTIKGGTVFTGRGDTLTNCVFLDSTYESVNGGGFVTNSIFDSATSPSVHVPPGEFMLLANSLFMHWDALLAPGSDVYLLNNDFAGGFAWTPYPGEGNFAAYPCFAYPGPPTTYLPCGGPPLADAGADVGLPFAGAAPDVGAFEFGIPITPRPPSNLAAGWNETPRGILLTWTASPDDPYVHGTTNPIYTYLIYRSEAPDSFLIDYPYMQVSAGVTYLNDGQVAPGVTYYYQVRASAGPYPSIVTAPTDTASFTVNLPPVALNPGTQNNAEGDNGISLQIVASDPDLDTLTFSAAGLPPGLAIDNATGLIGGSLDFNSSGTYSVTVNVSDATDITGVPFTWTVNNVNRPPVAADDAYAVNEDTNLIVATPGVLTNDSDPDLDNISTTLATDVSNGTLALNSDGSFTYTPSAGYSGPDSFTYRANDATLSSNPVTVTIVVNQVNNRMRVASLAVDIVPGKGSRASFTADVRVVDEVSATVPGAVVTGQWSGTGLPTASEQATTNSAGIARFQSAEVRSPSGTYTFTVTGVTHATFLYDEANSVTQGQYPPPAPNNPPVAVNDSAGTTRDTPVIIDVTANDYDQDGDGISTYSVANPQNGSTQLNPDDTVTYTPNAGYTGSDSFTYTIKDVHGDPGTATVTLTVIEVPTGGTLHVGGIALSWSGKSSGKASATVTVIDGAGAPVGDVVIHGQWSGTVSGGQAGTTDGSGTYTFVSPRGARSGTYTLTVTDLVKQGWSFVPGPNDSGSITP